MAEPIAHHNDLKACFKELMEHLWIMALRKIQSILRFLQEQKEIIDSAIAKLDARQNRSNDLMPESKANFVMRHLDVENEARCRSGI